MGLFDYVTYTAPCPICGKPLTKWQSKSGPCACLRVEPSEVDRFYDHCENCGTQVEVKMWKNVMENPQNIKKCLDELQI